MELRQKMLLGVCSLVAGAYGTSATAQTAPAREVEAGERGSVSLEEIVVTARRREESLQEVPATVAAVTGETLESQGVRQLSQLTQSVPGLLVTASGGAQPTISMRGETNRLGVNPPGVGVFVDGIYQNRFSQIGRGPVDAARVEVAKGPQSSLYGKNTIGGAIGIVTNDPTSTPEGYAEFGYGGSSVKGEDLWHGELMLSGPVAGDDLLGRIVVQKQKRDGYLYDRSTGVRVLGYNATTVRAKLLWNVTPDLSVKLTFAHYRDNAPRGERLVRKEAGLGLPGINPGLGRPVDPMFAGSVWDAHLEIQGYTKIKSDSLALHINWDTPIGEIQSTSSYQKSRVDQLIDTDATSYPSLLQTLNEKDETYQQEVRLVGGDGPIKYIAGVYYLREDNGPFPASLIFLPDSAGYAAGLRQQISGLQKGGNTVAAYGQLGYDLTDSFNITGGLRWARDYIDQPLSLYIITASGAIAPGAVIDYQRSTSFRALTGDLTMSYKLDPDVMLYGRYARGDRAGGFNSSTNVLVLADIPYKPQTVDAFEIGLKSEFFDRRVRLNLSGFYNAFKDIQVTTNIPNPVNPLSVANVIVNAAKANVPGVEVDFSAVITKHLRLNAVYNYLDAKIKKYELQPGQPAASTDITGMRIPRSPKHSGSIGLLFETDLGGGEFKLAGDMFFSSSFAGDYGFNAVTMQRRSASLPAREIFNLNASYEIGDWQIGGYVRNLFNRAYFSQSGIAAGSYDLGTPGEPRTFEVTLRRRF